MFESQIVSALPSVLHRHDVMQRRESRFHVWVVLTERGSFDGVLEELACEYCLGRHGGVTFKGRVLVIITGGILVVVDTVDTVDNITAHGRWGCASPRGDSGDSSGTVTISPFGGARTTPIGKRDGQVTEHGFDTRQPRLELVNLALTAFVSMITGAMV